MKSRNGSRGIALHFVYLNARWRWMFNVKTRSLYPQAWHGTDFIGDWVGLRTGLDGWRNILPYLIRCPDRVSRSKWQYRLSYPERISFFIQYQRACLLIYSMVQSPSWEANWFAASQEILRILWNTKVHYRTHKRPSPVPIQGQPNPVHIPTSNLLEIHSNIIHPSVPRSPQWSLSLRLRHHDPINSLSSPIRATSPANPILLDFITRTSLGEDYRLFSYTLYNHLHLPVTSSLLSPNILLNIIFSNTLSFLSFLKVGWPSFIPIENNMQNYSAILIFKFLDSNLEEYRRARN